MCSSFKVSAARARAVSMLRVRSSRNPRTLGEIGLVLGRLLVNAESRERGIFQKVFALAFGLG